MLNLKSSVLTTESTENTDRKSRLLITHNSELIVTVNDLYSASIAFQAGMCSAGFEF